MSKLTLLALALVIGLAAADDCTDDPNFRGTQPQNLGKSCAEQSPDNCKFIDESIKACCGTCQNRQNEKPVSFCGAFAAGVPIYGFIGARVY